MISLNVYIVGEQEESQFEDPTFIVEADIINTSYLNKIIPNLFLPVFDEFE